MDRSPPAPRSSSRSANRSHKYKAAHIRFVYHVVNPHPQYVPSYSSSDRPVPTRSLTLTLFMFRINTDNANHSFAFDDFTLVTYLFDRRAYFHTLNLLLEFER